MEIRRWLVAGLLFATLWVFVSGPQPTPTTILGSFIVGLAVGLPVAFVFRRLYEKRLELSRFDATYYMLLYAIVFTKEIVVANVDVAYRVLSPRMPLVPQVILIPLRVETSLGITTIANSITLTPGTMTLDYDPDHNALYVHIIDGRHPDEVVEPIRQWEKYALEIFDEDGSPEDKPPGIFVHPPDYPPEPKTVPPEEFDPGVSMGDFDTGTPSEEADPGNTDSISEESTDTDSTTEESADTELATGDSGPEETEGNNGF